MKKISTLTLLLFFSTFIFSQTQVGSDIYGVTSGDRSGSHVSINSDGSRVAIGAKDNDGNGTDSGQVRIFEWDGSNRVQLGNDIYGDGAHDEFSVVSISANGDRIVIGTNAGSATGYVKVFEWNGSSWVQLGNNFTSTASLDYWGSEISISPDGTRIAIGAPYADIGATNTGLVNIYEWDGTTWNQLGSSILGISGLTLGTALDLSSDGSRVVIGGAHLNQGRALIYDWDGTLRNQVGTDIYGSSSGDYFGDAVSISNDGTRIIIGARYNSSNGSYSGQCKIFEWNSSAWIRLGSNIEGDNAGDESGISVDISGDGSRAIIGAPREDTNGSQSGQTRIFDMAPSSVFHTFIGSVNSDWDNPSNWDTGLIPLVNDFVFINSSTLVSDVNISGTTPSCRNLTINDISKSLTINTSAGLNIMEELRIERGDLINQGDLTVESLVIGFSTAGSANAGNVYNSKNINLNGISGNVIHIQNGLLENNDNILHTKKFTFNFINVDTEGELSNYGIIQQNNGSNVSLLNAGITTNHFTGEINLFLDGGRGITNYGTFTNDGIISIKKENPSSADLGPGIYNSISIFNNSLTGSITINDVIHNPVLNLSSGIVDNFGLIEIEKASNGNENMIYGSSSTIFNNYGTLKGEGKMDTPFNFAGNLNPGHSPGKIIYDGSFDLGGGYYNCELEGLAGAGVASGNDLFEVLGALTLDNSKLNITTIGGFSPQLGDQFTILTANSIIGNFLSTSLPSLSSGLAWDINIGSNSVVLEVILNPLPIELSSFEVFEKNKIHQLQWRTESEFNSSHFEIEYSLDEFHGKELER